MEECKAVKTPLDVRSHLTLPSQGEIGEAADLPYQALIGALMYLAGAVDQTKLTVYLQGTKGMCLKLQRGNPGLTGYADADWAADQVNRRSCTGYTYIPAGQAEKQFTSQDY
ncbi:hypothetical protein JTB14_020048 [Gonioctena quinquepunctata]|nr:hypothetical protein JTB14_020048 [Gonioctena quinquepunctata]